MAQRSDPAGWTIRRIAAAVRQGSIRREAVAEAFRAVTESMETEIGAFVWRDRRGLPAEAGPGPTDGLLAGVPIGVKDVIDTSGIPTRYGSAIYENHIPIADASVVAQAKRDGAVISGKTTTTEFAAVAPTRTRNPRNPSHTPGGSSSGSAAAVAAGMAPAALGTQTAGSTIRPASFCGVVGYKPSYGLADRTGIKTLAQSLDTVGMFTRSVDCMTVLAASLCRRPALARAEEIRPRIGMLFWPLLEQAQPATLDILDNAARRSERAGATVKALAAPDWLEAMPAAHDIVMGFEMPNALAGELAGFAGSIRPETRAFIEARSAVTAQDYDRATASVRRIRHIAGGLFETCDVLLVPAAVGEAPEGLQSTGSAMFNTLWTLLHLPCITLPAGTGPNGLPIGAQLVAGYGEDAKLLSAAAFLETALPAGLRVV